MEALLRKITSECQLVISTIIIEELVEVTQRKFTGKEAAVNLFLSQLPYEQVDTPERLEPGLFSIRDESDYPVLYSALVGQVDLFITGDKDFMGLDLPEIKVITPTEFLEKY